VRQKGSNKGVIWVITVGQLIKIQIEEFEFSYFANFVFWWALQKKKSVSRECELSADANRSQRECCCEGNKVSCIMYEEV
jgi:uncharacterized protein (DUF2249 family)